MIKTDFFEENRRFSSQIECYAHRLKEPHAVGELWGFLWLLKQNPHTPNDDRYISRSLKNKFIDLYRKKKKFSTFEVPFVDKSALNLTVGFHSDIDFFDLLKPLSDREKRVLTLRYFCGFSVVEIAFSFGVSRQYINQVINKALEKLRNYEILV